MKYNLSASQKKQAPKPDPQATSKPKHSGYAENQERAAIQNIKRKNKLKNAAKT